MPLKTPLFNLAECALNEVAAGRDGSKCATDAKYHKDTVRSNIRAYPSISLLTSAPTHPTLMILTSIVPYGRSDRARYEKKKRVASQSSGGDRFE